MAANRVASVKRGLVEMLPSKVRQLFGNTFISTRAITRRRKGRRASRLATVCNGRPSSHAIISDCTAWFSANTVSASRTVAVSASVHSTSSNTLRLR